MTVPTTTPCAVDMRQENRRQNNPLRQPMNRAPLCLQHGTHTVNLREVAELTKAILTVEDSSVAHEEVVSAKAALKTTRILAL